MQYEDILVKSKSLGEEKWIAAQVFYRDGTAEIRFNGMWQWVVKREDNSGVYFVLTVK